MQQTTRGLTASETIEALQNVADGSARCQVLYPRRGRKIELSPLFGFNLLNNGSVVRFLPESAQRCSDLYEVTAGNAEARLRQSLNAASHYLGARDYESAAVALEEAAGMATELDEVHDANGLPPFT